VSTERTLVTTLRQEHGTLTDCEGISVPVLFNLIMLQDVTDDSPVPEKGRGVVQFEPEAHALVKRYVSSRVPLTLVGGGIQVEISLTSAHDFLVVGPATATS
jgi:hypothetical protein